MADDSLLARRIRHLKSMMDPKDIAISKARREPPRQNKPAKRSRTGPAYDVEEILDMETEVNGLRKDRKFLVKWKGYGPEENSWVEEKDLNLSFEKYKHSSTLLSKLNGFKKY